jgi:hypothetical protein
MRFENNAAQVIRRDTVELDDLIGSGVAGNNANAPYGNSRKPGEESDDRIVSLAIDRRCSDV